MRPCWHLVLAALIAAAPLAGDDGTFAGDLLAELNRARVELGLEPVEADPALAAVAQRRVEAMARDGWFGLVSPAGDGIEQALDAAGYRFRLATEKVTRTTDGAAQLASSWRAQPDRHRNSLFLAGVRRVGIGETVIASGERLLEVVLVDAAGSAAPTAAAPPADAEGARQALRHQLAERRRESGLAPLVADRILEQAAQEHAEALLAALARGEGAESIAALGDRLAELEASRHPGGGGPASGGSRMWGRETGTQSRSTRYGPGSLAAGIVVDAATAEAALATLAATAGDPAHLDPAMRKLGVGVAAGDPASGGRSVWVVALRPK